MIERVLFHLLVERGVVYQFCHHELDRILHYPRNVVPRVRQYILQLTKAEGLLILQRGQHLNIGEASLQISYGLEVYLTSLHLRLLLLLAVILWPFLSNNTLRRYLFNHFKLK